MKELLPIHLKVEGRKAVVVGGGKVAERRVDLLNNNKARILLISPEATDKLKKHSNKKKIDWLQRKYRRGDLEGAFIGIFAANDIKAEQSFIDEAKEKGILVNVSTDYNKCDFIFPAVAINEDILITVSTSGAFPLLSAEIAHEIKKTYGDKYNELIKFLLEARDEIKRKLPPERRKEVLKAVLEKKFLIIEALKKGRKLELEELID